jgi:copper transport protein
MPLRPGVAVTSGPAWVHALWRGVAATLVLGALAGPWAMVALAHSQLVASIPAAGDVVPTPPALLRLTFSEPIDPAHTSLDLLSGDGTVLATAIGSVDPSDAYTLVAKAPALTAGTYTVNWRSLSAADGHSTSGTYSFGIGDVSPPPISADAAATGSIHAGHDEGTAFLETESRILGDLGAMLASGLPVIAWLVLRWARAAGAARAAVIALIAAATGAAGLVLLGGSAGGVDLGAYATTRTGMLLVIRLAVAIAAALAVWVLARRRPRAALAIAGLAGFGSLVLVALGGHAAAFTAVAPVLSMVAHLAAAAVWVAGLLTLAWLVTLPEHGLVPFATLVPRFSALAVVSIGLVAATGIYEDWLQTGTLVSAATPYQTTLLVKVALTIAALVIGFVNYRSAGRDGRFGGRVIVEAGLAVAIVIATGLLASGSPPGQAAPIQLAPVTTSALDRGQASLGISPGRPGPTEFTATFPSAPDPAATVSLDLSRLDEAGETELPLRSAADRRAWVAPGGLLPANSRFDAAVIVRDAGGVEQNRTRFSFALDDETVVSGRAEPPIDPVVLVVLALAGAAIAGAGLLAGGRSVPGTDRRTGRVALLGGTLVSMILAVAVFAAGSHP